MLIDIVPPELFQAIPIIVDAHLSTYHDKN